MSEIDRVSSTRGMIAAAIGGGIVGALLKRPQASPRGDYRGMPGRYRGRGACGDFPHLAGEVLKTFPEEADHVKWVQEGSKTKPKGTPYGDPAREGGQHVVEQQAMPGFAGTLTPEELDAVVLAQAFHEAGSA